MGEPAAAESRLPSSFQQPIDSPTTQSDEGRAGADLDLDLQQWERERRFQCQMYAELSKQFFNLFLNFFAVESEAAATALLPPPAPCSHPIPLNGRRKATDYVDFLSCIFASPNRQRHLSGNIVDWTWTVPLLTWRKVSGGFDLRRRNSGILAKTFLLAFSSRGSGTLCRLAGGCRFIFWTEEGTDGRTAGRMVRLGPSTVAAERAVPILDIGSLSLLARSVSSRLSLVLAG